MKVVLVAAAAAADRFLCFRVLLCGLQVSSSPIGRDYYSIVHVFFGIFHLANHILFSSPPAPPQRKT